MELTGTIISIGQTEQKAANLQVRNFVIEVANSQNPQYNDFIEMQLMGQRTSIIDSYKLGDMVKVTFDIRGRKWISNREPGKVVYFTTLNAWKIDSETASATATQQQPQAQNQQPAYAQQPPMDSNESLPF